MKKLSVILKCEVSKKREMHTLRHRMTHVTRYISVNMRRLCSVPWLDSLPGSSLLAVPASCRGGSTLRGTLYSSQFISENRSITQTLRRMGFDSGHQQCCFFSPPPYADRLWGPSVSSPVPTAGYGIRNMKLSGHSAYCRG